jgi:hypothetical protein
MEKRSLGFIETWGFVPAIEAADAGTKAANVRLLGYQVVPVGRVMVAFAGEVAAVQAAVKSGAAAAAKVGEVLAVHVIPRPDRQVRVEPSSKPLLPPGGARPPEPEPPEPEPPAAPPVEDVAAEPAPKSPPKRKRASGKRKAKAQTGKRRKSP